MRALRSMRILGKHWKLTIIAVFSLSIAMALGIIALSVSNHVMLLPPAAADPERLVMIYSHSPSEDVGQISYPDYQYFRENNHVFSDLAAAPNSISLTEDIEPGRGLVKLISRPISGNYMNVMGVRPLLGRLLSTDDEKSKTRAAVMMYACWKRMGADPNIIGKVFSKQTIVGVMPKEFTGSLYGINGDLLVTMLESNYDLKRDARHLMLIGRLKPGVSRRQAQAEMTALSGQLASAYPADDKDRTAVVTRATMLPPDAIPGATLMAGVLMAVVLLVLLIACANVANLLLAVAVGRRQEAVIKLALGAPRARLIREFLKESAMLCVASGALGLAIAAAVTRPAVFRDQHHVPDGGRGVLRAESASGSNGGRIYHRADDDCDCGDGGRSGAVRFGPEPGASAGWRTGSRRNGQGGAAQYSGDRAGRGVHGGAGGDGAVREESL